MMTQAVMMEDMQIEEEIQELIGRLRERRWSDEAIARELGCSGATIHRWRHRKQGVHMAKLVKRALEELLERP
jgi:hypothetical protein